jgi:putative tryptophan/tyrosine transport system substrate-binding protein
MRRREFMAALAGMAGGASAFGLRPTSAQADSVRLIAVLIGLNDRPEIRSFVAAFVEELARLGWIDGRNARIEQRWTNADLDAGNCGVHQPDVTRDAVFAVPAPCREKEL